MEKSTDTIEKVSHGIHDDLGFSILSKLPLKSLKRFGCVRKSWSLLSEYPLFMSMFRNNFISNTFSYSDSASLILHLIVPGLPLDLLYSLSGERFEYRLQLDWPKSFPVDTVFDICGSVSVNGILCVNQYIGRILLWNPANGEFKVIPSSPFESLLGAEPFLQAFGYDRVRDDHKVIRHVTFQPGFGETLKDMSCDPLWEIYSLRSNSWRKIETYIPTPYQDPRCDDRCVSVYMDGGCHWLGKDNQEKHEYTCLVSFDLGTEVLFKTPVPSNMDDSFDVGVVWSHLVVLNQSIALTTYNDQTTTFHISILGELGKKESWINLFTVGPLTCVEQPIGVGKKVEIFFRRKDKEIVWFDISTQKIQKVGLRGDRLGNEIIMYEESFLSVTGINS